MEFRYNSYEISWIKKNVKMLFYSNLNLLEVFLLKFYLIVLNVMKKNEVAS